MFRSERLDPRLFDLLASVQGAMSAVHGSAVPLIVTSGYRTPKHNAGLEGAARASLHLAGRAVDLKASGYAPVAVAVAGALCGRGGVGIYPNFCHLDIGEARVWGRGRKAPPGQPAPRVRRMPEVVHGLSTLVENAADFARSTVRVQALVDAGWIEIEILDDGPGFASDILPRLDDLTGRLLILHGMADDNVIFGNATRVIDALQAKSVPFEMMLYPGQRHGVLGGGAELPVRGQSEVALHELRVEADGRRVVDLHDAVARLEEREADVAVPTQERLDALRAAGIAVFGPSKEAAQIEGSKAFAKDVMSAAGVRTARAEQIAVQLLADSELHEPQALGLIGDPTVDLIAAIQGAWLAGVPVTILPGPIRGADEERWAQNTYHRYVSIGVGTVLGSGAQLDLLSKVEGRLHIARVGEYGLGADTTDFVARNDDFIAFAKQLAASIAASSVAA